METFSTDASISQQELDRFCTRVFNGLEQYKYKIPPWLLSTFWNNTQNPCFCERFLMALLKNFSTILQFQSNSKNKEITKCKDLNHTLISLFQLSIAGARSFRISTWGLMLQPILDAGIPLLIDATYYLKLFMNPDDFNINHYFELFSLNSEFPLLALHLPYLAFSGLMRLINREPSRFVEVHTAFHNRVLKHPNQEDTLILIHLMRTILSLFPSIGRDLFSDISADLLKLLCLPLPASQWAADLAADIEKESNYPGYMFYQTTNYASQFNPAFNDEIPVLFEGKNQYLPFYLHSDEPRAQSIQQSMIQFSRFYIYSKFKSDVSLSTIQLLDFYQHVQFSAKATKKLVTKYGLETNISLEKTLGSFCSLLTEGDGIEKKFLHKMHKHTSSKKSQTHDGDSGSSSVNGDGDDSNELSQNENSEERGHKKKSTKEEKSENKEERRKKRDKRDSRSPYVGQIDFPTPRLLPFRLTIDHSFKPADNEGIKEPVVFQSQATLLLTYQIFQPIANFASTIEDPTDPIGFKIIVLGEDNLMSNILSAYLYSLDEFPSLRLANIVFNLVPVRLRNPHQISTFIASKDPIYRKFIFPAVKSVKQLQPEPDDLSQFSPGSLIISGNHHSWFSIPSPQNLLQFSLYQYYLLANSGCDVCVWKCIADTDEEPSRKLVIPFLSTFMIDIKGKPRNLTISSKTTTGELKKAAAQKLGTFYLHNANEALSVEPTSNYLVMETSPDVLTLQTLDDRLNNSKKVSCEMITFLETEIEKNLTLIIDGRVIGPVKKFKVQRMQDPRNESNYMKLRFATFVPFA